MIPQPHLCVAHARPEVAPAAGKASGPRKGMQLGKAKKANDFLDSLRAEGEIIQACTPPFSMPSHAAKGCSLAESYLARSSMPGRPPACSHCGSSGHEQRAGRVCSVAGGRWRGSFIQEGTLWYNGGTMGFSSASYCDL